MIRTKLTYTKRRHLTRKMMDTEDKIQQLRDAGDWWGASRLKYQLHNCWWGYRMIL